MAKIKRFADSSGRNDYKTLATGMCLGALLMFLYLGPHDDVEVQSLVAGKPAVPALRTLGQQQVQSPDTDGWHPINVFYGDVSGLKTGDEQWFSQVNQDRIIVDLLGTDGYFMDLAANEAVEYSNTLALERQGWNGLCIEPNPTYWYGLSHRKCTVVGALLGEKVDPVQVKFRGVYGGIKDLMENKMANRKKEPQALVEDRYTAPIKDVLKRFNVPKTIDYLSLDIEGAEHLVMKNFPFDEYSIKVLTVERPNKELKNLLESNGYIMVKSLAWWGETLWVHKSTGFTADHPKIAKIKEVGK
jgi:hypothetical protein